MPRGERAEEIFRANQQLYGRVPTAELLNVCHLCLGPKNTGFSECNSCSTLFGAGGVPRVLQGRVVPMTTVINPSPWYSALQTYKTVQWNEFAPVVGAVAFLWFREHIDDLQTLLGGDPSVVTIVPSKRPGVTYATQALRRVLTPINDLGMNLAQTLEFQNAEHGRSRYTPEIFSPAGIEIRCQRVIVVEDTWTTGATALSACGALLAAGAQSVVLTPIARMFNNAYFEEDHPYRGHLLGAYDLSAWPR